MQLSPFGPSCQEVASNPGCWVLCVPHVEAAILELECVNNSAHLLRCLERNIHVHAHVLIIIAHVNRKFTVWAGHPRENLQFWFESDGGVCRFLDWKRGR